MLELRIPVAKYTAAKAQHDELRRQRAEAKVLVAELHAKHKPLIERTKNYAARATGTKRKVESLTREYEKIKTEIVKALNQAEVLEERNNTRSTKRNQIISKRNQQASKLKGMEADVDKLKKALAKCKQKIDNLDPEEEEQLKAIISSTPLTY